MLTHAATRSDIIEGELADRDEFAELAAALAARLPCEHALVGPDEAHIRLPESLFRALRDAAQILGTGDAVFISPLHRRMSTTAAADLLGVSRQYLTRLIDRGEIPCERTGRHRRLKLSDVVSYKERRDHNRRTVLDELTAESEELGAYD